MHRSTLIVPKDQFSSEINKIIQEGETLLLKLPNDLASSDCYQNQADQWQRYTQDFIESSFSTAKFSENFRSAGYLNMAVYFIGSGPFWKRKAVDRCEDIKRKLTVLYSVKRISSLLS